MTKHPSNVIPYFQQLFLCSTKGNEAGSKTMVSELFSYQYISFEVCHSCKVLLGLWMFH